MIARSCALPNHLVTCYKYTLQFGKGSPLHYLGTLFGPPAAPTPRPGCPPRSLASFSLGASSAGKECDTKTARRAKAAVTCVWKVVCRLSTFQAVPGGLLLGYWTGVSRTEPAVPLAFGNGVDLDLDQLYPLPLTRIGNVTNAW